MEFDFFLYWRKKSGCITAKKMASELPRPLLMMVARFVASDRLKKPVDFFQRLRALRLTNRTMRDVADSALRGELALVLRIVLPQLVSTQRLLRAMTEDTKLAQRVVETKSTSPGILRRLVDLSDAASGNDDAARHARALIDSAKGLLRESLERATVGTGDKKVRMYDDPKGLADKVIERLKRGDRYEPITDKLVYKVRTFLMVTSTDRAECKYGPLCLWDVSAVADFNFACSKLHNVPLFTSDLYWDTSSATQMTNMFSGNVEFKGDLSTWDVSKVVDMRHMFQRAGIEDSGIGNWNTASLVDAASMFKEAKNISVDLDLSGWDTKQCTNMTAMFQGSAIVDCGLGRWDVTNADTTGMLDGATSFRGDLTKWTSDKQQATALAAGRVSVASVSAGSSGFGTKPSTEKQIQKIFAEAARRRVVTGSEPGCTIL